MPAAKPSRADRHDPLTVEEEGDHAAAQNRPDDSHQGRTEGTARIAARHDGLGGQTDQRSKADPHQDFVGRVLENQGDLGIGAIRVAPQDDGAPIGKVAYRYRSRPSRP